MKVKANELTKGDAIVLPSGEHAGGTVVLEEATDIPAGEAAPEPYGQADHDRVVWTTCDTRGNRINVMPVFALTDEIELGQR